MLINLSIPAADLLKIKLIESPKNQRIHQRSLGVGNLVPKYPLLSALTFVATPVIIRANAFSLGL
jgi:hypothetical protein